MAERLVWQEPDGLFVFADPNWPDFTYDFYLSESQPADHWIEHMARKSWVTDAHIAEFRSLLAVSA